MVSDTPIPFEEAIAAAQARSLLPTGAGSAELSLLDPLIRERAWFSARTNNAQHLDTIRRAVTKVIQGGSNKADAKLALFQSLNRLGYSSEAAGVKPGSLQDLASDARMDLIVQTNADMLRGQGHYNRGQMAGRLRRYPALELFRRYPRKEKRDWVSRWRAAGGKFYGGGRMIALKGDPIWEEISRFDLPYPPFDFNSGMWTKPVSRAEAIRVGLITEDHKAQGTPRAIAHRVEASLPTHDEGLLRDMLAYTDRAAIVDFDGKKKLAVYPSLAQLLPALTATQARPVKVPLPPAPAAARKGAKQSGIDLAPDTEIDLTDSTLKHIVKQHGPDSSDPDPLPGSALAALQQVALQPDAVTADTDRDRYPNTLHFDKVIDGRTIRLTVKKEGKRFLRVQTAHHRDNRKKEKE